MWLHSNSAICLYVRFNACGYSASAEDTCARMQVAQVCHSVTVSQTRPGTIPFTIVGKFIKLRTKNITTKRILTPFHIKKGGT